MFYSVRARLTLWYTGILAVVLVTFSGISYVLLARAVHAFSDSLLEETAREFSITFLHDPPQAVGTESVPLDFRYSDRAVVVLSTDGRFVTTSRSHLTALERKHISRLVGSGFRGFATLAGGTDGEGIRIFASPIDRGGVRYVVVVMHDLDAQAQRLQVAGRALLLGIPLTLLLAAGGGYLMARKSLAPVTMMSLKARQIGAETLAERITVANERDELGLLATTLNELLGRLQRAFESQRSFMADASHELRTPLAIIQGEADVSLSRPQRTAGEYRESIAIIQTAARKLTRIVESLFLLARSDAGRYPISRTRFYLDELVLDCVRAMRSVASMRNVELTCLPTTEMVIVADEALLHRMIQNLIDNALKFTLPGGRVSVSMERSGMHFLIRVSDTGAGVAAPDRQRIFERFYRGERARSSRGRSASAVSTGAGLGLPIARWIAEIHGGELMLEHTDESGTTFKVALPAKPEEQDERINPEHAASSVVQPRAGLNIR